MTGLQDSADLPDETIVGGFVFVLSIRAIL